VAKFIGIGIYLKHLKEGTKSAIPYLTLDWISKWKNKGFGNLEEKLNKLKEKAPEKNKEYYQNTVDFIKHTEYFDSQARGRFLRCDYNHIVDIRKYNFKKLHAYPVILKTKNGTFKYVQIVYVPKEAFADETCFEKELLFIDFENREEFSAFLKGRNEEPFSPSELVGLLKSIDKDEIDYIDYVVYDLDKFRPPKAFEKSSKRKK
jgi:hypothetical protein